MNYNAPISCVTIPVAITPAATAAASAVEQTFTVNGAIVGQSVFVTPPGITAGVAPVCARVTAANTVGVTFLNPTAGALTAPAGLYRFSLLESGQGVGA